MEDPLEKEMATHSSILGVSVLENPHGQRKLAGYSPWGDMELDMTERTRTHAHTTWLDLYLKESLWEFYF